MNMEICMYVTAHHFPFPFIILKQKTHGKHPKTPKRKKKFDFNIHRPPKTHQWPAMIQARSLTLSAGEIAGLAGVEGRDPCFYYMYWSI